MQLRGLVLAALPDVVRKRSPELRYRLRAAADCNKIKESMALGTQRQLLLDEIYVEPGLRFSLSYLGDLPRPTKATYLKVVGATEEEASSLISCWKSLSDDEPRVWRPPRNYFHKRKRSEGSRCRLK